MYEKVNPGHPDKIADRIAGAIVDLAYSKQENPRVAVEVLIGHDNCFIINETNTHIDETEILDIVKDIVIDIPDEYVVYKEYEQNEKLANIGSDVESGMSCGDNGFFKGCPFTNEEKYLTAIARELDDLSNYHVDGKYLLANNKITICLSHLKKRIIKSGMGNDIDGVAYQMTYGNELVWFPVFSSADNGLCEQYEVAINPLGEWTGDTDVDSGATNRKISSDLGSATCGGGLHGKDLTKPDVSVPIYLHILAEKDGKEHTGWCAIGDARVHIDGEQLVPFDEIIKVAKQYIDDLGGFEKLAEWGLIR